MKTFAEMIDSPDTVNEIRETVPLDTLPLKEQQRIDNVLKLFKNTIGNMANTTPDTVTVDSKNIIIEKKFSGKPSTIDMDYDEIRNLVKLKINYFNSDQKRIKVSISRG